MYDVSQVVYLIILKTTHQVSTGSVNIVHILALVDITICSRRGDHKDPFVTHVFCHVKITHHNIVEFIRNRDGLRNG